MSGMLSCEYIDDLVSLLTVSFEHMCSESIPGGRHRDNNFSKNIDPSKLSLYMGIVIIDAIHYMHPRYQPLLCVTMHLVFVIKFEQQIGYLLFTLNSKVSKAVIFRQTWI